MKPILTIALTCLCTGAAFAQSSTPNTTPPAAADAPRASFQISLGGALPLGSFGSKDPNSDHSGLAKLGPQAEIAYSHPINHRNYGFIIGLRGRMNAVDNKANIAPLEEQFSGFNWSANNSSWKAYSAMAGLYVDVPTATKLDIHFEFGVGAAKTYVPTSTVTGTYDSGGYTRSYVQAKILKNSATTFSATWKAGIKYHLDKHWQLLASLDVWYLDPNFKNLTETVWYVQGLVIPGILTPGNGSYFQSSQYSTNAKQSMTTLNLSLGIARSF